MGEGGWRNGTFIKNRHQLIYARSQIDAELCRRLLRYVRNLCGNRHSALKNGRLDCVSESALKITKGLLHRMVWDVLGKQHGKL